MRYKRLITFMITFCFLISTLSNVQIVKAAGSEEIKQEVFDDLRIKIKEYLVPSNYDENDSDIKVKIQTADESADKIYARLNKASDRTSIFTNYTTKIPNINIQNTYNDLKTLSIAYKTKGSKFYKDETLKSDIISALEWLYDNWYNDKITLPTGEQTPENNWFCYEIGAAWPLADMTVILYDELTSEQRDKYMKTVELMCPDPTYGGHTVGAAWASTGANRAWKLMAILSRASVVKDVNKLSKMNDWMESLFDTVKSGDGFYADGSFIQHDIHPYTAGYGWGNLSNGIDLLVLLTGTPWEYNKANKSNVFMWIFDAFAPNIYNNRIFDNLSGREISRTNYSGPATALVGSMLNILPAASNKDQTKMKSMIKNAITADEYVYYKSKANIRQITQAKAIVNEPTVENKWIDNLYKQYVNMDRVAVQRDKFAFGISMHSNRIANYEAINNENIKGWNTSNGRTTILDEDRYRYLQDYWSTVDYNRLPGTTATNGYSATLLSDGRTSDQSKTSNKAWVGGTDMNSLYGVTGMELAPAGQTLNARKSWFVFDDEIVALGSGINSKDNKVIETTVENAKIKDDASNKFTVDGQEMPEMPGWKKTFEKASWAHLQGNVEGSEVGYYFPDNSSIKAIRDEREGYWKDINLGGSSDLVTRNYLTLWFNHGVNPVDAKYSYVLLPGKSEDQTKKYASNSDITVVENSKDAQAVRENKLNALAVNFWEDKAKTVDMVTSNKKASVFIKETPNKELELSVSDPTMLNNNYIDLELSRTAYSVISKDQNITVTQMYPSVKLRVNVSGAKGQSFKAKFNLDKDNIVKSDITSFRFDVTPNANNINGVVGFAPAKQGLSANDIALGVRLNAQGNFEAINGNSYGALEQVPYQAGNKYTVEMELNSKTGKYDAYVKQAAAVQKETIHDEFASLNKVFDKSSNWMQESGKTSYKRNKATDEYLTYKVTNMESFTAKVNYNYDPGKPNIKPITDRAKIYISSDNKTWSEVSVNVALSDSTGGLNKTAVLTPTQIILEGMNYLKIVFVNAGDAQVWSPQIDDLVIVGRTESLVEYKRIKIADDYAMSSTANVEDLFFAALFSDTASSLSLSNLIIYSDKLGTNPMLFEPDNNAKNTKPNYDNNNFANLYALLLSNAIDNASFINDSATEGDQVGQYKAGSKTALSAKITEASTVLNNEQATNDQIINAIKELSKAIDEFMAGRNEEIKKAELEVVIRRAEALLNTIKPADNQTELRNAVAALKAINEEAKIVFGANNNQAEINNMSAKLNEKVYAAYNLLDTYDALAVLTSVELKVSEKLKVEETAEFEIVAKDDKGNVIAKSELQVEYVTSDSSIVNIDGTKAVALKDGSAEVYAKITFNGKTLESNKVNIKVEKKSENNNENTDNNSGNTNNSGSDNDGDDNASNSGNNSGNSSTDNNDSTGTTETGSDNVTLPKTGGFDMSFMLAMGALTAAVGTVLARRRK